MSDTATTIYSFIMLASMLLKCAALVTMIHIPLIAGILYNLSMFVDIIMSVVLRRYMNKYKTLNPNVRLPRKLVEKSLDDIYQWFDKRINLTWLSVFLAFLITDCLLILVLTGRIYSGFEIGMILTCCVAFTIAFFTMCFLFGMDYMKYFNTPSGHPCLP